MCFTLLYINLIPTSKQFCKTDNFIASHLILDIIIIRTIIFCNAKTENTANYSTPSIL